MVGAAEAQQTAIRLVQPARRTIERLSVPHRLLCLLPVAHWPIGELRIVMPLKHWARKYGGEVRVKCIQEVSGEELAWADSIVLQRESNVAILGLQFYTVVYC
jgi:hypothetical protein